MAGGNTYFFLIAIHDLMLDLLDILLDLGTLVFVLEAERKVLDNLRLLLLLSLLAWAFLFGRHFQLIITLDKKK
jgi:hypothetical protein